ASMSSAIRTLLEDEVSKAVGPARAAAERRLRAFTGARDRTAAVRAFFGGDEVKAGEIITHVIAGAAIDQAARAKAILYLNSPAVDEGSRKFQQAYHRFRNAFIEQLRPLDDLDPDDVESVTRYIRARSQIVGGDVDGPGPGKVYNRLRAEFDDPALRPGAIERARTELANHEAIRQGTWNDLLDGLSPEALTAYLTDVWPTIGNWDDFTVAHSTLRDAVDDLHSLRPVEGVTDLMEVGIDLAPELLPAELLRGKLFDQFLRPTVGRGRHTVARLNTVTKQQAAVLRAEIKHLLELRDHLSRPAFADFGRRLSRLADERGIPAGEIGDKFLSEALAGLTGTGLTDRTLRKTMRTIRDLVRAGADPEDAVGFIDEKLAMLNRATDVWASIGIPSSVVRIEEKLKKLGDRINFLASEVDAPPELRAVLAARGYKPVHGVNFYFPDDLVGLDGPLGHLTHRREAAMSFGRFLGRQSHEAVETLRARRVRVELANQLRAVAPDGNFEGGYRDVFRFDLDTADDVGSDISDLLARLKEAHRDVLEQAKAAEDTVPSLDLIGKTATRARNAGLPQSVYDLRYRHLKAAGFVDEFGERGTRQIVAALRKAKQVGWEHEGLVQIERSIVGNNHLKDFLYGFSHTDMADGLGWWGPLRQAVGGNVGRRIIGAGLGAAAGYGQAGWEGAGVGAVGGAAAPGLLTSPRYLVPLAAGNEALDATGGNLAAAGAVAVGTRVAMGAGARALLGENLVGRFVTKADRLDARNWRDYSRIADGLVHYRDKLRFGLSPFFDLQRYTEATALAATADLPPGVRLPLIPSPKRVFKGMTDDEVNLARERFRQASRGWIDLDDLEATERYFREVGIMGFSPHRWMTAAHHSLVSQGMDAVEAAHQVRRIYTYGITGRSAAEQSINFVFFPFSFMKKYSSQVASFLAKDLGRAVAITDAMRLWSVLNERYDLNSALEKYVPLAEHLRKFNQLAYGLSPGELGGINRIFADALWSSGMAEAVGSPIFNLFVPQGVFLSSREDGDTLRNTMLRLAPAYRDIRSMVDDVKDQGHVLFSPSHMARAAEREEGWAEYQRLQTAVDRVAAEVGLSGQALMRSDA
ncbi:MAG TPA: hypothetical protein VD926_14105, partial [Acidimicrobiales bacterium]|nr:hypothetical protein [Acidimicrobiales bacterium]